jgi:hypothetical protein
MKKRLHGGEHSKFHSQEFQFVGHLIIKYSIFYESAFGHFFFSKKEKKFQIIKFG